MYIFYPIFTAVYNAERLLFRDSFFIQFASSDERRLKTNQRPICSTAYLLHLQPIVVCMYIQRKSSIILYYLLLISFLFSHVGR